MLPRRRRGKPATLGTRRYARELGVSPGHLSRVMSGERQSEPLVKRLEELLARESETETKKQNQMTYDCKRKS